MRGRTDENVSKIDKGEKIMKNNKTNKVNMTQANSVEEYMKKFEKFEFYDEIYYRGQLEKYETISPSVARRNDFKSHEYDMFMETLKCKKEDFKDLNTFQILSKMQHYGIPTRLVDITTDKLTALYFAVEDYEDKSDSVVYVYVTKGFDYDSQEANILSLLPTIDKLDLKTICTEYSKIYNKEVSAENILSVINSSVFIKYSDDLIVTNPRLKCQKGAFFLCGNEVNNDVVTTAVKSLDTVIPTLTIRIPYEYKKAVLDELDINYNINKSTIYPELTTFAEYIKAKYTLKENNMSDEYTIVKRGDVSTGFVKRADIYIVLNERIDIETIKNTVRNIIKNEKKDNRVLWIFVALNYEDFITYNWIVRCIWIDPTLDEIWRPINYKNKEDSDGCSWCYSESYSTMGDNYKTILFSTDDKTLIIYHKKIWDIIQSIYDRLNYSLVNDIWEIFVKKFKEEIATIHELYEKLNNIGYSCNSKLNDFFKLFYNCISKLDILDDYVNDNYTEKYQKKRTLNCLNDIRKEIDTINNGLTEWITTFNISEQDYNNVDINNIEEENYEYIQTIPVNPDAIDVNFKTKCVVHNDKTIHIEADTNLFDGACLMLTMITENNKCCQTKSIVSNRKVIFQTFNDNGNGFSTGKYKFSITLSIPQTQSKEFIKFAGIEYENLTGEFIKREGIGVTGRYDFEIEIE